MANPPSGDSPEGRQPEVPEPAKVEFFILTNLSSKKSYLNRLQLRRNPSPWQKRTCSQISPMMSSSALSGERLMPDKRTIFLLRLLDSFFGYVCCLIQPMIDASHMISLSEPSLR